MKTRPPAHIRAAAVSLLLVALNSLTTQLLFLRGGYATSFVRFAAWAFVYLCVASGLAQRFRTAFWVGLVVALLQLTPALFWQAGRLPSMFGREFPGWYSIPVYVAALLGVSLLFLLLTPSSRSYIFGDAPIQ